MKKFLKKHFIVETIPLIKRLIIVLFFGIIIVLADQLTKDFLFDTSAKNYDLKIIGIGKYLWNFGVSFSTFTGMTALIQTFAITITVITLIAMFLKKVGVGFLIALLFISFGSIGNIIDRIKFDGGVRDLIYFPWWESFAVFNIADSFAVIGGFILAINMFILIFKKDKPKDSMDEKVAKK